MLFRLIMIVQFDVHFTFVKRTLYNIKSYLKMKDMQKIRSTLYVQKKTPTRFNIESQLSAMQAHLKSITSQQQQQSLKTIIGDETPNARQKLKCIKKILQSTQEKDISIKKLVNEHLLNLNIKEYLFGNTQSKPFMIIILKLFDKVQKITVRNITSIFQELPLQQFTEAKFGLQLIECFTKNNQEKEEVLGKEDAFQLQNIKKILMGEFQTCTKIVFGDGFKYKWLEHYVDVVRVVNIYVKIVKKNIDVDLRQMLIKQTRLVITQYKLLTKEVLTQLYLLLIFINPEESAPEISQGPCIIHYYHAQNIILNKNVIGDLLSILHNLKETEYKCQFVPILLKAFQQHYQNYPHKRNLFDQVVPLFEVGRSVYSYLEQIISMIMKSQESIWKLEGSYLKKFFITTIALKNKIPTEIIFKQWPTIIMDVINLAGSMIIPYATDCASFLLKRLYEEADKNYEKWSVSWLKDYERALLSEDRNQVRGVVEFINPIILQINSEPSFLLEIISLSEKQNSNASKMGKIALLKCYKDLGKIKIDNQRKSFIHTDDTKIELKKRQIEQLLLNVDSNISLKTFQFLTVHPKGSQPMEPLELQITIQFYINCLKTSTPEFRKSYLAGTKKMFERLRITYDHQVTLTPQQIIKKRYKSKPYFEEFKIFLQKLIDICYKNVFPDVIFELANPSLQILLLIGNFFSRNKVEIKKAQFFDSAHILLSTNFFKQRNFDNLLCCLQSSYESVRLLAHQILQLFYDLKDTDKLNTLWQQSLINANKLPIKSYEYACRILAFISQIYPKILNLPKKYSIEQLNICQLFLNIIKQRYQIFKNQFATQEQTYYQNLIHGMLTVFSYTLDRFALRLRTTPQKYTNAFGQIKQFLNEFFILINNIVMFSVQVCSSNISTVVLDTLPQSQTDRKYKVDCRGHFLEQTSSNEHTQATKKVGGLIQSSALLASMQNQEEGVENTLVVSFYLLTRQAGLVFQSIGNITATHSSQKYLPTQSLVDLVNTYFYALINLKHMGSVDRIAGGLGKMAKLIFDSQDPKLSQLPDKLLQKLIVNLQDGKFTNILRRSAGVPYAFTCLLKSQSIKRKQMVQKTAISLLQLSQNNQTQNIQLRIHALNILKKVFQDSDLKADMDPYTSQAFIASIKGFTSEEWGVRNSSLMLFTILANRTVGIKPTYNLLQFFHRCPQLLQFFSQQLQNMQLNTMYPPLYPIVLLLSRLLPFDVKEKARIPNMGELNLKQIRKDKLLEILPLIEKAGLNSNHMGRVMAAKAILPFMEVDGIIPYVLKLLHKISDIKDNNIVHYRLVTCFNLLLSLKELTQKQKYQQNMSPQISQQILVTIQQLGSLTKRKQSAVISEVIFKMLHHLLEEYRAQLQKLQGYTKMLELLTEITQKIMKRYFANFDLIVKMNMGNSMAIKQCLDLNIDLIYKYQIKPNHQLITSNYAQFLTLLISRIDQNASYLKIADTQIIEEYLRQIYDFLKEFTDNEELKNKIRQLLDKLDMRQIGSDNILIKVIELRTILRVKTDEKVEIFLKEIQNQTKNHFLMISIFKYLSTINSSQEYIIHLLYKYSKPDQLEQLRECCVQYFQICPEIKPEHYVPLIRLLEDEEYILRMEMARIVSGIMKIPQMNDEVVKNMILKQITIKQFQIWLRQATDYEIKRKNYQEERIFSYDKPNKYRSDITNFIYCLGNNNNLIENQSELRNVILKVFEFHGLDWKKQSICILQYIQDIINRNEYQFQTILRIFLLKEGGFDQQMNSIFQQHPLLQEIKELYTTK